MRSTTSLTADPLCLFRIDGYGTEPLRAAIDAQLWTNVILDFGVWSKDERNALRFLAAEVGAISELHYVTASHDEQLRRISSRSTTDPHTSFEISNDERRRFRTIFQEPSAAELTSSDVEPAPVGYDSWRAWAAKRWPTSMA